MRHIIARCTPKTKKLSMLLACAALSAPALTVGASLLPHRSLNHTAAAASQPLASAPDQQQAQSVADTPRRAPMQVVRFTLYDVGLWPAEAHAQAGRVIIAIEDFAGSPAGVIVERERDNGRERVGQVPRAEHDRRGRQELILTPGRYRVSDAARPDNAATLIVEP